MGTLLSGARSDAVEKVRFIAGRRDRKSRGGEDERIPVVLDVGTGVGYLCLSLQSLSEIAFLGERRSGEELRTRLNGRGKGGDEYGSNAGSSVGTGAGRLMPAVDGTARTCRPGEVVIVPRCPARRDANKNETLGQLSKRTCFTIQLTSVLML